MLFFGIVIGILITVSVELLVWCGYCMGKEDRG